MFPYSSASESIPASTSMASNTNRKSGAPHFRRADNVNNHPLSCFDSWNIKRRSSGGKPRNQGNLEDPESHSNYKRVPLALSPRQHPLWSHLIPVILASIALFSQAGNCGIINFDIPDIVEQGTCPMPHIVAVDMERFDGVWYEVQQVPNQYVDVKECIQTKYMYNGSALLVTTEGLDEWEEVTDQEAVLSPVETPSSETPYFKLTAINVPPVSYHILQVNYSQYACVYSCFEVMELKVEVYSILTRDPHPSPESLALCHNSFTGMGLSLAKLQPVKHTEDCWYNEESSHSSVENSEDTIDSSDDNKGGFNSHKTSDSDAIHRVDDDSALAEPDNILLSVLDQANDSDETGAHLVPIKGYKRILVGDDTIVNLNITKFSHSPSSSSSSSSVKKTQGLQGLQQHDASNSKGSDLETAEIHFKDTETPSVINHLEDDDQDQLCGYQCQDSIHSSSTAGLWDGRSSGMTFGVILISLFVWN